MISRRSLFGILAGAVAAPIVARSGLLMPVKALSVPDEFVITAVSGGSFLNPAIITREALRILHQKICFEGRLTATLSIPAPGFKVGDTIRFSRTYDNWPANHSDGFPA